MCNFCEFGGKIDDDSCYPTYDYYGDNLEFVENIGAERQDLEVNILDDIENECWSLWIDATHLDVKIKINFCPICGRKL